MDTAVNLTGEKKAALLDVLKQQFGRDQLRDAFYKLYKADNGAAVRALGDERLRFPTLYALLPEITKLELEPQLNARSATALSIIKQFAISEHYTPYESRAEDSNVLKWMIKTGYAETDLGDDYNRIMDLAATLLIKEHHDNSCLAQIAEMMFIRHRMGLFTYDLEWAFFECADTDCLAIIVGRLLSKNAKDVLYARRLLKFLPCFDANSPDLVKQHKNVTHWLSENRPYLYYTGESNLMCGDPCRFKVSQESKYLQKPLPRGGDMRSLPSDELRAAQAFASLDERTKDALCDYSSMLRKSSREQWQKWMGSPIAAQIASSGSLFGRGTRNGNS